MLSNESLLFKHPCLLLLLFLDSVKLFITVSFTLSVQYSAFLCKLYSGAYHSLTNTYQIVIDVSVACYYTLGLK